MIDWQPSSLAELIDIKHGFAFKGQHFVDYQTNDVLVTPGNFAIGGGFKSDKLKYYDGPVPDEYVLQPGDLIVTMTDLSKQADTLGYSAIVPKDGPRLLHNQRIGLVTSKDKAVSLDFLGWLMRTPAYRNCVVGSATGSTVKHTSPTRIKEFEFLLPPENERNSISATLNALDDKIELNRRMNGTLEAQARALFRDWFVDFGPVKTKMAGNTPYLAPDLWSLFPNRLDDDGVPEGWKRSTIAASFNLTMGQSPPGDTYNDDGEGLPFFQGRTDFGFRYPENRKYCDAPKRVAEAEDTLVSVRAPVGDINLAWEKSCVGRGVAALRHKSGSPSFTYYCAAALRSELEIYQHTGTVFGAINKKQFEALKTIEPTVAVLKAFDELVEPMDRKIRNNELENRTLIKTRDLLLPKLMSGEIRVGEAEREIERS